MFVPCPIRLVVADSDPLATSCLCAQLSALGYLVVAEATNGQEVVSLARQLLPDAVVMAVEMPDVDGLEASQEIDRERLCPVILLGECGHTVQVQAVSALSVVQAWLVKPVSERDLEAAVELAVARFRQFERLERETRRSSPLLDMHSTLAPETARLTIH